MTGAEVCREHRVYKDCKELQEPELRVSKVSKEFRADKEFRVFKELRVFLETKEYRAHKE
jgi:hypothetical protein